MKQEKTLIHDFTEGPILPQLFRFGAPFILSNLLQTVYNLVDMVVVGQVLGSSGLSAVATGGELLNMFTFVCMGLTTAGQVIIAQLIGRKQTDRLQHFIGTMFSALVVAALVFSVLGIGLADWFMGLLNVPPEAQGYAKEYILVCFIGLVFIYGYNTVSAILRGMGDSHHPLLFIAVASVTNLVLDIVFVVGLHLGAAGAALATVMGQGISFLLSVWFLYRNRSAMGFDFRPNRFLMRREPLWMLWKLGIPMSLQFAAINVSNLYINSAVNSFGVVCSAVSGVGTKLNSIMSIVAAALISAGATMVGQNFGAGKLDRIRRVFYSIMAVTVSFSLVLGIVMLLFPHQVFRIFSQDTAVLAMAPSYAPVAALCFLGAGLRSPAIAFVNGIGATSMNYIMGILDGVVLRIGLAWLLGSALNLGITGYWYGSAIAGFTFFVVGAPYYWSGIWKKRLPSHRA